MTTEEYRALDGRKEALNLIRNGQGTVTPYGVIYDNGMKLEQLYQDRQFPLYIYDDRPLVMCATPRQGGEPAYFALPATDRQIGRSLLRAGIANLRDTGLSVEEDNLPPKISARLHLEQEGLDDLNDLCRELQRLEPKQQEMLEAVVCAVQPDCAIEVRKLAENLNQFYYIPDVHTAEEYGRYLIREFRV